MKKRYSLQDYEEQVRLVTRSIVKHGFAVKKEDPVIVKTA